jgi:lipid II:glycine glycyltransferase (peptidoglycan interpeptide bridge formation enzyme)
MLPADFKYIIYTSVTYISLSFREKETHLTHLRNLEEELDAQVARVEAQAREEARVKFELEKRSIEKKMQAEMEELQANLKLFQKVSL